MLYEEKISHVLNTAAASMASPNDELKIVKSVAVSNHWMDCELDRWTGLLDWITGSNQTAMMHV